MKHLIMISLLIAGCGNNRPQSFAITGFEVYYAQFVSDVGVGSNDLVIKFGNPAAVTGLNTTVGVCERGNGRTPTVIIDEYFWAGSSEGYRQEIIDHELGHCILNRDHNNAVLPNGWPASIMNAYLFNPQVIDNNKQYYFHELKGE